MSKISKQDFNMSKNDTGGKMMIALSITVGVLVVTFICGDALAVDLDKAAKAATDPLIKAVNDHWGKVVALAGAASAAFGEGDLRTRAIRAAIGSGAASAAVLGIMAAIA